MTFSSTSSDAETISSPVPSVNTKPTEDVDISTQDYEQIVKQLPEDFDSWTECKKQAWNLLPVNPNGFFYRHVLPGEVKRNGPWTEAEKIRFIQEIKKHPPVTGHWGSFSRNIPGRVGYQCNAFYKKLVAAGEIEDIAPKSEATKRSPKSSSKKNPPPPPTPNENAETEIVRPNVRLRNENSKHDELEAIEASNKSKEIEALKAQTASLKSPLIPFLSSFRNFSLFEDYRISNICTRPIMTNKENLVEFEGSVYACDGKIYDNFHSFIDHSEIEVPELFHESLSDELRNNETTSRFNEKGDFYFRFT